MYLREVMAMRGVRTIPHQLINNCFLWQLPECRRLWQQSFENLIIILMRFFIFSSSKGIQSTKNFEKFAAESSEMKFKYLQKVKTFFPSLADWSSCLIADIFLHLRFNLTLKTFYEIFLHKHKQKMSVSFLPRMHLDERKSSCPIMMS